MSEVAFCTNISWSPQPNWLLSVAQPLPELVDNTVPTVGAAFVFASTADGRLLLADVTSRGLDVPGGHVEDGETPRQAAVRELAEETGVHADDSQLDPVGYLHLHHNAAQPVGHTYSWPDAFMEFFVLQTPVTDRQLAQAHPSGDEVQEASLLPLTEALQLGRAWCDLAVLLHTADILAPTSGDSGSSDVAAA